MAREINPPSMHPVGMVGILVFCAVFAAAFGTGGYWFGLKPLALTLQSALAVRGWQPVPAQVVSVQLEQHTSRKSSTFQVHARYRYEFGGRPYEGSRVGLDTSAGADNVGDWHERWHTRLQAAQARGEPITVLVNPSEPAQSLIDPDLRWPLLAFRLPFAVVFTGVGLGAAWWFFRVLGRLLRPGREAQRDGGAAEGVSGASLALPAGQGQSPAASSAGPIWLFSIFWCCIAFPMAGILWTTDSAPWFAKIFIGLFVAVGLGLMAYAMGQTRKAWRYAGTVMTALPARPRAGHPVEVTLLLPPRAAAHQQGQDLQLRLAQYRVDEASSGSPERRVEWFTRPARTQPMPDGGLRLVVRFDLPNDAPPHRTQRSGERVDWRVELLHGAEGEVQLTYDIPVQAAQRAWGDEAVPAPADRFDRQAKWSQVTPIEWLDAPQPQQTGSVGGLPRALNLLETPEAWRYAFARPGWRWSAGWVLVGLAADALIHERLSLQGFQWPRGGFAAAAWWAAAAFVLHAATCRWRVWVSDAGLTVQSSSWLWMRRLALPGEATGSLVHKLLYTTGSGGAEQRYYAVYARDADTASLTRLTPGVAGEDAATAVGRSFAQAWAERRDRFSPGALRPPRTADAWRPAWGAGLLVAAMAWSLWGPTGTLATSGTSAARQGAPASPSSLAPAEPEVFYSEQDGRLLDAQNAGDAAALRAALAAGANPDLLAPNGSSVLMLAAHRGQLGHIDALLAAGAQPDLRQTRKDSERGDTALLRAFYGGHLAAAQRLVQAGASLAVRNRWDWGPVHMAAQSGCIPCLDWLAAQGQLLDEPAPASRGETPTMLAAGRGRVNALQWFEARGIDLARQDAHGKTALDWAQFKQQAEAAQWLASRQR